MESYCRNKFCCSKTGWLLRNFPFGSFALSLLQKVYASGNTQGQWFNRISPDISGNYFVESWDKSTQSASKLDFIGNGVIYGIFKSEGAKTRQFRVWFC